MLSSSFSRHPSPDLQSVRTMRPDVGVDCVNLEHRFTDVMLVTDELRRANKPQLADQHAVDAASSI